MGIGVTFEEAFQKALRMVDSTWIGFCHDQEEVSDKVRLKWIAFKMNINFYVVLVFHLKLLRFFCYAVLTTFYIFVRILALLLTSVYLSLLQLCTLVTVLIVCMS